MCDGGRLGGVSLPEEATDRGPEPADRPLTFEVLVLLVGVVTVIAECHCRRGELHGPYPYLSVYEQGRSRTLYVPAALEPTVAGRVAVTQRNEALLSEISQINLELLRRRALE